MDIIEQLFKTKIQCERLHQAALCVLLREPSLLARLCQLKFTKPSVSWEPDGGHFDLAVADEGQPRVLIELKIDDDLTPKRVREQLKQTNLAEGEKVLYLLLGVTGISRGSHWPDWKDVFGDGQLPLIRDSGQLRTALEECIAEVSDPVWKELAGSYIRVLERLTRRVSDHENKEKNPLAYFGYYDAIRRAAKIEEARIQHVPRSDGGFICLAWGRTDFSPGVLYLQLGESKLRLKVGAAECGGLERPKLRERALAAALRVAAKFPQLEFVSAPGRSGKTMTLGEFKNIPLGKDPEAPELLARIAGAEAFLREVAQDAKA